MREWALQVGMQYISPQFNFTASLTWANHFKSDYRISQRKVTRYIKPTEQRSLEDLQRNAIQFQDECRSLIQNYNLDFVLNVDQMGCEYQSNVLRTLEHKGKKTVNVHLGDLNKVTHTYTAQYTIAASGKFLNKVFLCLQEPGGKFGPRVQEKIDQLCDKFKNVHVTCSKSGKLSTNLYDNYLENVLKPYVNENKFLLILDGWTGQTNVHLFDKFKNDKKELTCTRKIIPAGCTAIAQPLDVYMHRQIKLFIKHIQNCTYVLQEQRYLNTRDDAVKLHSIIAHQLSAPVFKNMIEYSWYAAKLINDRDVFANVKEVCFPETVRKPVCSTLNCNNSSFICCSWCKQKFCFICFYDEYHPGSCANYFTNL